MTKTEHSVDVLVNMETLAGFVNWVKSYNSSIVVTVHFFTHDGQENGRIDSSGGRVTLSTALFQDENDDDFVADAQIILEPL